MHGFILSVCRIMRLPQARRSSWQGIRMRTFAHHAVHTSPLDPPTHSHYAYLPPQVVQHAQRHLQLRIPGEALGGGLKGAHLPAS